MLGDANLNLADVDVGQRESAESRGNRWGEPGRDPAETLETEEGEGELQAQDATVARVASGMVDDFA